jgi:hypothetical protein
VPRLADPTRFGEAGQGGSWYSPPYPETLAEVDARWPQFAERAAWLHAQYPSGTIGIVGSGYGWTLYFLNANHGRTVRGVDGQWAIAKAKNLLGPTLGSWVDVKDALSSPQMNEFRLMGNKGKQVYSVVLTEDVLPSLASDAEVATALAAIRTTASAVVHLVTTREPGEAVSTEDMLWHTAAEWRALIGPTDRIITASLMEIDAAGNVTEPI